MPKLRDLVSRVVLGDETWKIVKNSIKTDTKEKINSAINKVQDSGNEPILSSPSMYPYNPVLNNKATKKGGVTFQLLRDFSIYHWATRACISKRQEQINGLDWDIIIDNENNSDNSSEKQAEIVEEWFRNIMGQGRSVREFFDIIIDDLLTLDVLSLYKVKSKTKKLLYLQPIDGATIRLRVNKDGFRPMPPDIAFEQWIRGNKTAEFTTEELIYSMMNSRSYTPYGLSPLESLIITVQSALKSELSNMYILQEGNVPEGFIQTPPEWTPDQIKTFQEYWDGLMAGNLKQTRRVKMIPGGAKGGSYIAAKKPGDMQYREFEEWLTIKTCALFGVSPQSIGITWNLNKATAQEQSLLSRNESIKPLAGILQEVFTNVIKNDLGYKNLKFKFLKLDSKDEAEQAEIDDKYIKNGVYSIDEVRARMGKTSLTNKPMHFVMSGSGPILVSEIIGETQNKKKSGENKQKQEIKQIKPSTKQIDEEQKKYVSPVAELKKWQKKAIRDIKDNRKFRKFESNILDDVMLDVVSEELRKCQNVEDVKKMFKKYINESYGNIIDYAQSLANELDIILSKKDEAKDFIKIKGDSK